MECLGVCLWRQRDIMYGGGDLSPGMVQAHIKPCGPD